MKNSHLQGNVGLKDGNLVIVINCGSHLDSLYVQNLSQHSIITGFPMCEALYTQSLFRILSYTLCDKKILQRRNALDLDQSLKPYATSFTPYEYRQHIQSH